MFGEDFRDGHAGGGQPAHDVEHLVGEVWVERRGRIEPTDVAFASGAGALATPKRGAWEGLPTRAELDAFLAQPLVAALSTVDERGALSFAELDRRANALAHALAAGGIGSGDGIAVYRVDGVR